MLNTWFNEANWIFGELQPDPQNVYNMDQTGFMMQGSNIIISKDQSTKLQASAGRQEWISVVECISIDGMAIPPLIIFKGERLCDTRFPPNVDESWKFSCQINE